MDGFRLWWSCVTACLSVAVFVCLSSFALAERPKPKIAVMETAFNKRGDITSLPTQNRPAGPPRMILQLPQNQGEP